MNEIEKMYKNCGIKKLRECECNLGLNCVYYGVTSCYECEFEDEMVYPPFTADKQIDLIKWLAKKNLVVYNNLGGWHLGIAPTYDEELGMTCKVRATSIDSLKEAIAGLINDLWQDLTEEEKQQIKEILK